MLMLLSVHVTIVLFLVLAGKFRPDYGLLLELHALALVALSYHCKNILVISTIFWSSQLHADVCVTHYKTSKGCFLFESKVEKLLSYIYRIFLQKAYSYLVTLLPFLPATKALLQGQMCRIKETPTSHEML